MGKITTKIRTVPNMILIGSTARNSGKTTLAVAIIEKYKNWIPVYGIKVTTIAEKHAKCIHGGEGCGVCTNFDNDFDITEELGNTNNKDTSVLLAGGAKKVYWLKTLASEISAGIEAVLEKIPPDALIICESNSLRKVVEPGVFVMVKNTADNQIKKTAAEVIAQADIVYENYFQDNFDEVIDQISHCIHLKKTESERF
nr:hypothetical protein [uncultured Acetobacterium sp.]